MSATNSHTAKPMREWLLIEDSRKNGVFAPPEAQKPLGYIPRDVAEKLLGRDLGGTQWFTREESALMKAHPEYQEEPEMDEPRDQY